MDTQERGPWRIVSEQVVQYLVQTRNIAKWLADFSVPNKDDRDPDFSPLENMIDERNAAVEELKKVDPVALAREPLTDDEATCRQQSTELLADIADIEKENEKAMQKFASQYREKLKSIRQARETMTAYNKAQAYSAAATNALGQHFNQAN